MSYKQMIGLALLSIGVVLMILASSRLGFVFENQEQLEMVTSSPLSPTEHIEKPIEVPSSNRDGKRILVIGTIFALVGLVIAVRFKEHRS